MKAPGTNRIPVWVAICAAEILVLGAAFLLAPLAVSRMELDRADQERQAAEVQQRAKDREQNRQAKRESRRIPEMEARELQRSLVDNQKKAVQRDARKLRAALESLAREREKLEKQIQSRTPDDMFARLQAVLRREILEFQARAVSLETSCPDRRVAVFPPVARGMAAENEGLLENPKDTAARIKATTDQTVAEVFALIREYDALPEGESRDKAFGDGLALHLVLRKLFEIQKTLGLILEANAKGLDSLAGLAPADLPSTGEPLDLPAAFADAEALSKAVDTQVQAIGAMELALLEGIPVEQAVRNLNAPPPPPPPWDSNSATAPPPATLGDLDRLRDRLAGASAQTSAMAQHAENAVAGRPGNPNQSPLASRQAVQLAATMERQSGQIVDLSVLMRGASSGSTGSAQPQSPSHNASPGSGGVAMGEIRNAQKGGGSGQFGGDSARNRGQGGGSTESSVRTQPNTLDTRQVQAEALPGRKFRRSSRRSGWLYLDTWYVIGPWENKGRIDYANVHPPEFEIDFSKSYTDGKPKDGIPRELRWQFTQASSMKVIPPDESGDSTYYGFTEVHFEEAQDMLLAIASDDAAKVWINGLLVWEDRGLGAWSLDEGFRKVHFNQGFNKILVRIENGPTLCNFSLLLCPDKP